MLALAKKHAHGYELIERLGSEGNNAPDPGNFYRMLRILEEDNTPAQYVDLLVTEGNRRGGLDNITVIVVRIDDVVEVTAN